MVDEAGNAGFQRGDWGKLCEPRRLLPFRLSCTSAVWDIFPNDVLPGQVFRDFLPVGGRHV